ncbi:hypothetical protein [Variovorax sp. MHTC-1]|uniref:hypothetical protein n=1 Tax=Variovorax sp. MHTC-1 TaxID=2495593 RepID=UPI000F87C4E8|nr:hypothetical protein [Variovorax sp. MHTC-1]RST48701.1 hypothetical protein EJI01_25690 [Variovorax sp. MHTC-1]
MGQFSAGANKRWGQVEQGIGKAGNKQARALLGRTRLGLVALAARQRVDEVIQPAPAAESGCDTWASWRWHGAWHRALALVAHGEIPAGALLRQTAA